MAHCSTNLPGIDFERVFQEMNSNGVGFILIGGLNYFLQYRPITTQDIDLYVQPEPANVLRCERALLLLGASWGRDDESWGPVSDKPLGWLSGQSVFCLLTDCGPLDIFLAVSGLNCYDQCSQRASRMTTSAGTPYLSLSTADMLACQLAIPSYYQRVERMAHLQELLSHEP